MFAALATNSALNCSAMEDVKNEVKKENQQQTTLNNTLKKQKPIYFYLPMLDWGLDVDFKENFIKNSNSEFAKLRRVTLGLALKLFKEFFKVEVCEKINEFKEKNEIYKNLVIKHLVVPPSLKYELDNKVKNDYEESSDNNNYIPTADIFSCLERFTSVYINFYFKIDNIYNEYFNAMECSKFFYSFLLEFSCEAGVKLCEKFPEIPFKKDILNMLTKFAEYSAVLRNYTAGDPLRDEAKSFLYNFVKDSNLKDKLKKFFLYLKVIPENTANGKLDVKDFGSLFDYIRNASNPLDVQGIIAYFILAYFKTLFFDFFKKSSQDLYNLLYNKIENNISYYDYLINMHETLCKEKTDSHGRFVDDLKEKRSLLSSYKSWLCSFHQKENYFNDYIYELENCIKHLKVFC